MALVMILGYLPAQHVHAASNVEGGLEGQAADVFTALGFDTTVLPEGYDPNTTENPFGREKLPGNQIYEMVIGSSDGMKIAGKNDNSANVAGTVGSVSGTKVPLEIFSGVAGDFDGDGLPGEMVYVGIPSMSLDNGSCYWPPLNMYLFDGKDNSFSGAKQIANVSAAEFEEFEFNYPPADYRPHRVTNASLLDLDLYGHTEAAAGDFDGDGYAEIAVYVPESGNARVDIYKWMRDKNSAADDWQDWANWSVVWSRPLSNSGYVPNMVSLVSSDINRDGIDDLGLSYSGTQKSVNQWNVVSWSVKMNSNAVILWGANHNMLQSSTALNLYENELGAQFRTSLTVGDLNDDGYQELIATGQPSANLAANTTRSIVVYSFDGNGGLATMYKGNHKIVDGSYEKREVTDEDGNTSTVTEWIGANGFDGVYRSMPYVRTNAAALNLEGYDYGYLYLDSCIYEYIEGSMTLKMCLDDESYDGTNSLGTTWLCQEPYIEFGAAAADLNGNGFHQLYTGFTCADGNSNYSCLTPIDDPYTEENELDYNDPVQYQRVAHRIGGYAGLQGNGSGALTAKTHSETFSKEILNGNTIQPSGMEEFPYYAATVADVDMDTTLLEYTGRHWLTYQDPKVLAVVAAAPYFEDVDIICDYDYAWQNTTSWSRTEGGGHGTTVQVDLEAGAYHSNGSDYHEMEIAALFTMEWAKESTEITEYTLTFETSQDEDAVAFFSIPTEHYEYIRHEPDGNGGYEAVPYVVSRPFQAVYQVLNLDYYESIRGDYSNLPAIRGEILKSTPGDPSSYPATTSGYDVITKWNDDPAGISFGNGAISQEITITKEESESYNLGAAVDIQAGGGYKGFAVEFMFGATFSLNPSGGWMDYDISGTTIEGTVTNMPLEFQDYGYYYDWALFSYVGNAGGSEFPVVSYLVNNVSEPPRLPADFQQDVERTTADKNVLTWTYDGDYSSFILYKYFDFPVGGGLQEIARFAAGEAPYTIKYDENGKPYYEFYFEDTNLAPYSEYQYAIQVERLNEVPPLSAPSGLLAARTKAKVGNPVLTIAESDGTNDGYATVYPDKNAYLIAQVNGPDGQQGSAYYSTIQYQWQKKNDQGKWEDLINETNQTLTIKTAGSDTTGEYRCRINVITNTDNTAISAYTGSVELVHSKRTSVIREAYAVDMAGNVKMYAKVVNAHTDSATVPDGYVTFNFVNTATGDTYPINVPLDSSGVATVVSENALPTGQYRVAVTYSGSYIFKSSTAEAYYLSGKDGGYAMEAPEAVTYGDGAEILFQRVYKDGNLTRTEPADAKSYVIGKEYPAELKSSKNGPLTPISGTKLVVVGSSVTAGEKYSALAGFKSEFTGGAPELRYYYLVFTAEIDGKVVALTQNPGRVYLGDETTDTFLVKGTDAGSYMVSENIPVGEYSIVMTAETNQKVVESLVVNPRPVTLQLPTLVKKQDSSLTMGDITYGELEVTSGSWANCDCDADGNVTGDLAATSVTPSYVNTAGTAYNKDTPLNICGYYTINAADNLDNYAVTYRTGSLSVIGGNQPVTFGVRPFGGQSVGTLYMVSPDYAYTREDMGLTMAEAVGSRVVFTAAPDEGYQVYDWYVDGVPQGITDNRFAYVVLNQATTVEVQFVFKPDTLVFGIAGETNGGTLTCSNSSLTSGSIVIPNTYVVFTAKALEGYHFKEWRYTELGKGTAYYDEDEGRMQSTFELLMPRNSCSLYAVFERDGYTFTYTDKSGIDGLTAWYWGNPSGDTTAALEKITVNSGDIVPGDTQIVIQPKDGYALDEDYNFVATGSQGVADYEKGTYTLTLTEDTEVTGYTIRNDFDLSVKLDAVSTYRFPEDAKIMLTVGTREYVYDLTQNGDIASFQDIPGGSSVTVEAVYPEYYTFSGWNLNGTDLNVEKYTLPLANDQVFTLKLTEKPVHKVTLADITGKGTYSVTLPEGAGQEGNVVTCHENDPLTIQITPEGGYTVTYWNVTSADASNSWETKASSLKYQFPQLTADYTFTPIFSGTTYHTVTWPTLRYYDVTLKPEEGYLTTVSSGGEFKFTLSGGEDQYQYVLVNGRKFYDDRTMGEHYPYRYLDVDGIRIYGIYNITANQEISVSMEEPEYGVTITPAEAEVGAGKTVTLTAEGYGIDLVLYKWTEFFIRDGQLHSRILQEGPDNTLVYQAPLLPGQEVAIMLQAGNYENGTMSDLVTANATITITDAVDSVAVTTENLTPAENGSYLIHPITPDNTIGKYDFDALVTMYSGTTYETVTWSLWGAQMRGTSVDRNGVLTVSPREYGINGQLKLTAVYTYPDGNTDKQDVLINLCPDAYVATEVTGADHGDICADIGYVSNGTAVTVTATADENHAVAKWYINGTAVSGQTGNRLTFSAEEMTHYTVSVEFTHYYPEPKHDETNHWYECSCGERDQVEEHYDFDKEHLCDKCGYQMSECTDENKDHFCDWCGVQTSACLDENKDHICDWCGDVISVCVDKDPTDHVCDWCAGTVGEHADINGNHFCDHCAEKITECADDNRDHNCDICGRELSACGDADSNHLCDICGGVLSQCVDAAPVDHICDICGGIVSECADNNRDHNCDACGREDITSCTDGDDHKCDICGAVLSQCSDGNSDHNCDICGSKLTDCADKNSDHTCDICGKALSECADNNSDHNCDICGSKLTDCTDSDTDTDHSCDVCGKALSECDDTEPKDHHCDTCGKHLSACVDTDEDGICDICSKALNAHDCTDSNADHMCDTCGKTLSECADEEPMDHNCDICGKTMSQCADSDTDTDHSCDVCGAILSDCADNNSDHNCDVCGAELTDCADNNGDHTCDVCGKTLSQCADDNRDHKCDICSAELSLCSDENGDHKCDVCGAVQSTCVDEDRNHKCDICAAEMGEHIDENPRDHKCDICEKVLTECIDADPKDHSCDTCGAIISECADENKDHLCDVCNTPDGGCIDEPGEEDDYADHLCDICGKTVSECADENLDHLCDVCGKRLSQCHDEDGDGVCDDCLDEMHACEDADSNHKCDACDYVLSECADSDKNHFCDICGTSMSDHTDAAPDENSKPDHLCDLCGEKLSDCSDADNDHDCDYCGKEDITVCEDENHDNKCDICGAGTWVHTDGNSDHRCDVCGLPLSECADADDDHLCDVCGIVWSVCADTDSNHACDICGASMGIHADSEGSHICAYCGKTASTCEDIDPTDHLCDVCGEVISECDDGNKDHKCDLCGEKLTDCADEVSQETGFADHKCDLCGEILTECTDENKDHRCDICNAVLSQCADNTGDHICDTCGRDLGECKDEDHDHFCDIAGEKLTDCTDENKDHKCDLCGETLSECEDSNDDHLCDLCQAEITAETDMDKDHLCDICGKRVSECSDGNSDHICDICGFLMSECTDENKDHLCDRCEKVISECADDDCDHACDVCGDQTSVCADTDKDGRCDICGAELGILVYFPDGEDTNTIVPGATVQIDGKIVDVNEYGEIWLSETGGRLLTTYTFNEDEDPHKEYPTAMYVWYLTWTDENGDGIEDTCTAKRISQLDNFLNYKGTSIRISSNSSNNGIRFFTDVPAAVQTALTNGTLLSGMLEGYKLVEMGTLYKWAASGTDLTVDNGAISYVYGGDAGEKFRLFSKEGSYNRFTGMLVGLDGDAKTLKADIVSRPFAVLENASGDQITLYGGSIQRSIYYVALQNRDYWDEGTAYDKYIESIIAKVEGTAG